MEQAALRETIEEAGVIGSVEVSVCEQVLFRLSFLQPLNNSVFESYLMCGVCLFSCRIIWVNGITRANGNP